MTMRRAFVVVVATATIVVAVACSGGGSSPTAPTPTPPTGTPVSTSVTGRGSMVAGTAAQFQNVAIYPNGPTDVTPQSVWSSSSPANAMVDAKGMVTALKAGDVQIEASYQGVKASMSLSVMPFLPSGQPFSNLRPGEGSVLVIRKITGTRVLKISAGPTGAGARWQVTPGLCRRENNGPCAITYGQGQAVVATDAGGTATIPVHLQDQDMLKVILIESSGPLSGSMDISDFLN